MGIERFEDIIAWQKARALTHRIYEITRMGAIVRDFGLSGQLQRATTSIMSNIAEGYERRTPRQFAYLLVVAKASCAEVRSWLYVAADAGYFSHESFRELMSLATEVARLIAGLLASIRKAAKQDDAMDSSIESTRNSELGTRNRHRQTRGPLHG